jgi:hypothetical protein
MVAVVSPVPETAPPEFWELNWTEIRWKNESLITKHSTLGTAKCAQMHSFPFEEQSGIPRARRIASNIVVRGKR